MEERTKNEIARLMRRRPFGAAAGAKPLWTLAKQLDGMWHLEMLGGARQLAITLNEDEFTALLTCAAAAAYSKALGEDVSDFP